MAAWRLVARLARTPAIRRGMRRTYLTLVVTLSVGAGLFTIDAVDHHVNTGHDVRDRRWPATWGNARFPEWMKQRRRTV